MAVFILNAYPRNGRISIHSQLSKLERIRFVLFSMFDASAALHSLGRRQATADKNARERLAAGHPGFISLPLTAGCTHGGKPISS